MLRPRLVAPQITVAEEQEEFLPVTVALVKNPNYPAVPLQPGWDFNTLVLAFKPSEHELAQLNAGKPLYLSMLTFGKPMQGVILTVGDEETAGMYNVEVER